ncbi:unnamed protein product [Nesidiocoris tenuis]|uniref:Uncharacterized protein n=1 Tax=Nesidiocoris tenuis TaxID=355587 RepID=A0A6H5GTP9_9HEMI|nr:unnamed protein product [Nesidiocoris tenuis]
MTEENTSRASGRGGCGGGGGQTGAITLGVAPNGFTAPSSFWRRPRRLRLPTTRLPRSFPAFTASLFDKSSAIFRLFPFPSTTSIAILATRAVMRRRDSLKILVEENRPPLIVNHDVLLYMHENAICSNPCHSCDKQRTTIRKRQSDVLYPIGIAY